MLEKILKLQNIGVFDERGGGIHEHAFTELTLVYASNAAGKTTLTSVLHSSSRGEPEIVAERQRLGQCPTPHVKLKYSIGCHSLDDGVWTGKRQKVHVFDEHFVRSNIFTPEGVQTDNKRNLLNLIVGERAKGLAEERVAQDRIARDAGQMLKEIEQELRPSLHDSFTLEEFLGLPEIEEIDEAIVAAQEAVVRAEAAVAPPPEGSLTSVSLVPVGLSKFEALLQETVEDLSADTAILVSNHIRNLQEGAEEWLGTGATFKRDSCPYCAQSTTEVPLVQAYAKFFGAAYRNLLSKVASGVLHADKMLETETLRLASEGLRVQDAHWGYWKDALQLASLPSVSSDPLKLGPLVHGVLRDTVSRKRASVLERIDLDPGQRALIEEWNALVAAIQERNVLVASAIEQIEEEKRKGPSAAEQRLREAKAAILRLTHTKVRHTKAVAAKCDRYAELDTNRTTAVASRTRLATEIKAESEKTAGAYGKQVNAYLERFGATFRLIKVEPTMRGGAGVEWCLKIRETSLSAAQNRDQRGGPCFRTALSAGDRTTLGLAFFLAVTMHDDTSGSATIALDDPMCSLDGDRRTITVQTIVELGQKFEQVIVLSHDSAFLGRIYRKYGKRLKKKTVTPLLISVGRPGSNVQQWEIDSALRTPYEANCLALKKLVDGDGLANDVARRCARELIEAWMRMRYPGKFTYLDSLGMMISQLSGEVGKTIAEGTARMLGDINEVAVIQAHDSDEESDPGEVRTMAANTLEIVLPQSLS